MVFRFINEFLTPSAPYHVLLFPIKLRNHYVYRTKFFLPYISGPRPYVRDEQSQTVDFASLIYVSGLQ